MPVYKNISGYPITFPEENKRIYPGETLQTYYYTDNKALQLVDQKPYPKPSFLSSEIVDLSDFKEISFSGIHRVEILPVVEDTVIEVKYHSKDFESLYKKGSQDILNEKWFNKIFVKVADISQNKKVIINVY